MNESVLYKILKSQTRFDSNVLSFMNTQVDLNCKLNKRMNRQKSINLLLFGGLLFVGSELIKAKSEMKRSKEPSQGKGVSDEC